MPRFDGTGPAGMGPMTGGGRGTCNPYAARTPGVGPYRTPTWGPARFVSPYGYGRPRWGLGRGLGRDFFGRGLGRGRGFGRGRGGW